MPGDGVIRGQCEVKQDGSGSESKNIVAIGASSGGPYALRSFLPQIPRGFDAGIVVVQHMPESFTAMLARWLDEICEIRVKEAANGDKVTAGRARWACEFEEKREGGRRKRLITSLSNA